MQRRSVKVVLESPPVVDLQSGYGHSIATVRKCNITFHSLHHFRCKNDYTGWTWTVHAIDGLFVVLLVLSISKLYQHVTD